MSFVGGNYQQARRTPCIATHGHWIPAFPARMAAWVAFVTSPISSWIHHSARILRAGPVVNSRMLPGYPIDCASIRVPQPWIEGVPYHVRE